MNLDPRGQLLLERSVLSMSPAELIGVTLDQAMLNLRLAAEGPEGSPWEATHAHLLKAQKAVMLLLESLAPDVKLKGQAEALTMAHQLRALYVWCLEELSAADIGHDLARLNGPLKVLGDIADGWQRGVLQRG